MSTELLITILLIGFGAGMLSGLVGVGGGIVMVPALIFILHQSQHQAQGTSLAVLALPVVMLAAINYFQQCKELGTPIDLKVVGLLALGFIVGGVVGSKIALGLNQQTLKRIFAIILFYTAFKMQGWDSAIIKWLKSFFDHR